MIVCYTVGHYAGVLVSDTSNLYPYVGYLQRVLTCSPLEKAHTLQEEFYWPNDTQDTFTTADAGFNKRYELTKQSKEFTMIGTPVSNLTTQNRYIPGGTQIRLVFRRSQPEFCLDSATTSLDDFTGVPFGYQITAATFLAFKRPMTNRILDIHKELSAKGPYLYPVTEMQCRTFVIPETVSSHSVTVLNGKIPRMVIVGLVDQDAFHGVLNKSPTNFKDFDLKEVTFSLNSETLDTRTIPLSFSQTTTTTTGATTGTTTGATTSTTTGTTTATTVTTTSGTDSYFQALRNLRKCAANQLLGNGIDVNSFRKGTVLQRKFTILFYLLRFWF